jgi:HPt (histidine-containing phosphotransfer) domain-containing protein
VIDESVLEEIAAMSPDAGTALLAEVIGAFREDTPKALADLASAARRADAGQVRDVAHRLKSSFANVGALEASRRCAQLCTGEGQAGAVASVQRLLDEFAALERALLDFLARRS